MMFPFNFLRRHSDEHIDLGHYEQPSEYTRKLYADTQVGLLVGYMVANRRNTISVQAAIDLLERKGRTAKRSGRYGRVPFNVYSVQWDEPRIIEVRELLAKHPCYRKAARHG